MKKLILALFCVIFAGFFAAVPAQKKTADYKLTAIKLTPFEQLTGEFEAEITASDERAFINEISKMYLVVVEVSGEAGGYAERRQVEITVTEGKKLKAKKIVYLGVINENGKFYAPMWVDAPLCDAATISARIIGQTKPARLKRTVTIFNCGE